MSQHRHFKLKIYDVTRFLWAGSLIIVFFLPAVLFSVCKRTLEPVKIGLAINLSGRRAYPRRGALRAGRVVNESGGINGRPLVLLVCADENNHEQIKKVHQTLIDEGVVATLGHSCWANTITAYPLVLV